MNYKNILLFFLLFLYFFFQKQILGTYFSFLMSLGIFLFCFFSCSKETLHHKFRYDKMQNFFLVLLIYFLFYFLSGLYFGYQYTPYQKDFVSIIHNTLCLTIPMLLLEYVRYKMLATGKLNGIKIIIISLFFAIMALPSLSLSIGNAYVFQIVCQVFLPLVVSHFFSSYLCISVGYDASIYYRFFFQALPIYLPIVPKHSWLLTAILGLLLPYLLYQAISSCEFRRDRRFSKRREKSQNVSFTILLVFVLIFSCFVVGFFHYQPIAVMSNSMKPIFSRGDTVIIEKMTKEDCDDLQLYDIIYFKVDNMFILHRIVEITYEDGVRYYVTKGDNNPVKDNFVVTDKNIYGKILFSVPYVGYPSVWFSEFLTS